ncbi:uncharacterized protein BDCG_01601 [Blastomyces dermatitidis ER-3]|uniref:Tetratricopeptide-like helical n=2 Tax=Blastomyces TaxID=229219 RepID=A0A179ULJ1_BLAGS|nr:uncharacterized protein BDBG_04537 [Blastomyces gilchristii SLH14081]XP_045274025.1 uncharacterized protein BDCG_01601 [Blastomyces dermatitidis ER-3]EEQ86481.1 hypothetical protein BDCG_01601 [Blastomyces dermatitidis ER-3]EQL37253.1 hypothetical protein BDFG_01511 [Blastomyces dermatitidis ATCC 26199]OAT08945.1 hypothetical protein BDBG_04537 [Blastomyces gilchristii SLH14081]
MPKPKTLLKEAKTKRKTRNTEPESADEYLATGVELEEAGEKWRAGDAVKSMRFFMRAIEMYDTGLRRFPNSFDLAYNKARIQYEITQHPKLATQLPAPAVEILHIALKSHRHALTLQQDNAEILFNTAQVLTSLAEAIIDGRRATENHTQEASRYLQEALDLFQRCLGVQELRFTEGQHQHAMAKSRAFDRDEQQANLETDRAMEGAEAGTGTGIGATEPTQSEQWATVIEPVTKDTLVDTAVAQLETLATFCGLLTFDPGSTLAWVEEYSAVLLKEKIAAYVEGTDRQNEVALARAKFISTLAEVSFRSGRIDFDTYKNEVSAAFGDVKDLPGNPGALCSQAESLVAFNSTMADCDQPDNEEALNRLLTLRWQALSSALDSLTAATKLPEAQNLPKIHLARGDVEMYRWRLGGQPWSYKISHENASTLLKNAQTYYRGAAALAGRDGLTEQCQEGTAKEAFAFALAGDMQKMEELIASSEKELRQIAEDMVDDGLVSAEDMDGLFRKVDPDEIVF